MYCAPGGEEMQAEALAWFRSPSDRDRSDATAAPPDPVAINSASTSKPDPSRKPTTTSTAPTKPPPARGYVVDTRPFVKGQRVTGVAPEEVSDQECATRITHMSSSVTRITHMSSSVTRDPREPPPPPCGRGPRANPSARMHIRVEFKGMWEGFTDTRGGFAPAGGQGGQVEAGAGPQDWRVRSLFTNV
eukprot:6425921-Pyramimonas_sp.AAC.1